MRKDQPTQPIIKDSNGTLRFQANALVRYLLDNGGIDMNRLATVPCSVEDQRQFAQLIGYSLGGYSELHYVDSDEMDKVTVKSKSKLSDKDATIKSLKQKLNKLRKALRTPIAELYGIHPDDLKECE